MNDNECYIIRKNNFEINPKKDGCKYCEFFDICFHKNDDNNGEEDEE